MSSDLTKPLCDKDHCALLPFIPLQTKA